MSGQAGETGQGDTGQDEPGAPSERARVRQHTDRARYGLDEAFAVLDAGLIAHVAVVRDGAPVVVPMAYGRLGATLYLHGGSPSRLLRALGAGEQACVSVTVLEGLVLARSAFKHSMNYRSVVAHGIGREVRDDEERLAGLAAVTDHNLPGRWASLRPPTRKELAATRLVAFPLAECAVKVREGGPLDAPEDHEQPAWAGVVPVRLMAGEPERHGGAAGEAPGVREDLLTN